LSALERAEQIDEWRILTVDKVRKDYAPSGGAQPTDLGNRKVAKELGISEGAVRLSGKIAAISDDAKDAAKAAGIDASRQPLTRGVFLFWRCGARRRLPTPLQGGRRFTKNCIPRRSTGQTSIQRERHNLPLLPPLLRIM